CMSATAEWLSRCQRTPTSSRQRARRDRAFQPASYSVRAQARPERWFTVLPEQRRDIKVACVLRRLAARGRRGPRVEAEEHVAGGAEDALVTWPADAAGVAVVKAVEQRIVGRRLARAERRRAARIAHGIR